MQVLAMQLILREVAAMIGFVKVVSLMNSSFER